MDLRLIAKAHFRLRGMHIHVHEGGIDLDEYETDRVPIAHEHIAVSTVQRVRERWAFHRSAVHVKILVRFVRAAVRRSSAKAVYMDAVPTAGKGHYVFRDLAAVDLKGPVLDVRRHRQVKHLLLVVAEPEPDVRMRHGKARYDGHDMRELGSGAFQEL